ncbi:MAG TPA: MazG-like family protein [Candidatus Dojkabacteria bacterium]|nr:MazG-like family protein [Candidatus Dojkabacteria bacterium]
MNIKDIQKWERDFTAKKGIAQEEEKAIKIAILKLTEEVGEVSKAILEKKWEDVPAEVTDVIVFACKVANIAEDFHNTEKLTDVMKKKLEYCEERTYDKETNKLDKPTNKQFS